MNTLTTQQVTDSSHSIHDMMEMIKQLQAENARLARSTATGGIKVSEKGGVSLYGINRFPITLYANQWEKVLGKADEIKAFIESNRSALVVK